MFKLCTTCRADWGKKDGGKKPLLSPQNGLLLDPIPDQLRGLAPLERQIIAQVQTCMTLVLLPHGGLLARKRQFIQLPMSIVEVVNQLPARGKCFVSRPRNQDGAPLYNKMDENTRHADVSFKLGLPF